MQITVMNKTKYLDELINSCITLTTKEIALVEDYIFKQCAYFYPPGYNLPTEVIQDIRAKTLASGAVVKHRKACK